MLTAITQCVLAGFTRIWGHYEELPDVQQTQSTKISEMSAWESKHGTPRYTYL